MTNLLQPCKLLFGKNTTQLRLSDFEKLKKIGEGKFKRPIRGSFQS